jgi:hypothetical protein
MSELLILSRTVLEFASSARKIRYRNQTTKPSYIYSTLVRLPKIGTQISSENVCREFQYWLNRI